MTVYVCPSPSFVLPVIFQYIVFAGTRTIAFILKENITIFPYGINSRKVALRPSPHCVINPCWGRVERLVCWYSYQFYVLPVSKLTLHTSFNGECRCCGFSLASKWASGIQWKSENLYRRPNSSLRQHAFHFLLPWCCLALTLSGAISSVPRPTQAL